MDQFITQQFYENYSEIDHETWRILCDRQANLDNTKIAKVYLDGFKSLNIGNSKIPKIKDISDRLKEVSGWTLIPVTGLLKPKEIFSDAYK